MASSSRVASNHPLLAKFDQDLDDELLFVKQTAEWSVKRLQDEGRQLLKIDVLQILNKWKSYFAGMPSPGSRLSCADRLILLNARFILEGCGVILEQRWSALKNQYEAYSLRRGAMRIKFPPSIANLVSSVDDSVKVPEKKRSRGKKRNRKAESAPETLTDLPETMMPPPSAQHTLLELSTISGAPVKRYRAFGYEDVSMFTFGEEENPLIMNEVMQHAPSEYPTDVPISIRPAVEEIQALENQRPSVDKTPSGASVEQVPMLVDDASILMPPPQPPPLKELHVPQIVILPPSSSTSEQTEITNRLLEQMDAQVEALRNRQRQKRKCKPGPPKKFKFNADPLLSIARVKRMEAKLKVDETKVFLKLRNKVRPCAYEVEKQPEIPGAISVPEYKFKNVFGVEKEFDNVKILWNAVDSVISEWKAKAIIASEDATLISSIPMGSLMARSSPQSELLPVLMGREVPQLSDLQSQITPILSAPTPEADIPLSNLSPETRPSEVFPIPEAIDSGSASLDAHPSEVAATPVTPAAGVSGVLMEDNVASVVDISNSLLSPTVSISTATVPESEIECEEKIVSTLRELWSRDPSATARFSDLCTTRGTSRLEAARTFRVMLNLWTTGFISMRQDSPSPHQIYIEKMNTS